ncbi:MAG: hypothetical protein WA954_09265 [Parerythrobacter sp.]
MIQLYRAGLATLVFAIVAPATAQDSFSDVTARTAEEAIAEGRAAYDAQPREPECGEIEGDAIVICAPVPEDPDRYRLRSKAAAEDDYARRTMDKGNPQAPSFAAPPCVPTLLTWCPKFGSPPPPATLIDVTALPQAPPGSDADRIARGLPPLGRDEPRREDPALVPAN